MASPPKTARTGSVPRLLPASRPGSTFEPIPRLPTYGLITWTFGRGSVIWRIWPAVLLHTLFAAGIVTLSLENILDLEIPTIMLTVLGVVIGFVISYRAVSGYERYWLGRTCWSDVMRNSRALGRLIWFHVPLRTSAKTAEEVASGTSHRSVQELNKVMAEKRMALDLIEGFAVALKHHIRGELGIYYEDLYHLVRPMHEHEHTADDQNVQEALSTALPAPRKGQRITARPVLSNIPGPASSSKNPHTSVDVLIHDSPKLEHATPDFAIPPINAYGTFDGTLLSPRPVYADGTPAINSPSGSRPSSRASQASSLSGDGQRQPLLPASGKSHREDDDGVLQRVSGDLIPFAGVFSTLKGFFSSKPELPLAAAATSTAEHQIANRRWQGPIHPGFHSKHRPAVVGDGQNLPLEILRCLSEWFSVLEDRGSVPGSSLGPMVNTITAFEDSLTSLERILTTPLPFVYSVHIRHTVWIYLFFLPFQLVKQFGYYTIPGVAIAAFIYLGFVAAGEEIEQPFGYDDNDLDLDLFCRAIIHNDIKHLKSSPCLNAYFGPDPRQPSGNTPRATRRSMTLTEITTLENHKREEDVLKGHDHVNTGHLIA